MSLNKISLLFRLKPSNLRKVIQPNLIQSCRPIISAQSCLLAVNATNQNSLSSNHNIIIKRFKKSSKRSKGNDDEDEDDDDDELAGENPLLVDDLLDTPSDGSQRVVIDVSSLRLDAFAKTAFGTTRAKIEEAFYKGELYLNGEKPSKKSCDLSVNDEIDLVKGVNEEDRSKINVRRVQLVALPDKASETGRIKATIDRWNDLIIDAHSPTESY